jgi:hypothetical protein
MLDGTPERVDIPHEPGQWFELRRLSWKQLRKARKIVEEEQREIAKSFGAEFVAALTSGRVDEDRARRLIQEQQYRAVNFDTEVMLEQGIVAWSYDKPLNVDTIEQLDERTAVWAVQEIINLCKPLDEVAEKNS